MRLKLKMNKIIFDSNIYDKLNNRPDLQEKIRHLTNENKLTILVPSTINRELENSPFKGVPNWFRTEKIGDSVFTLDYSQLDEDRLGKGDIYKNHKGRSSKFRDAIITETAETDADIFVSEDKRCQKRLKDISDLCQSMTFDEFQNWITNIIC